MRKSTLFVSAALTTFMMAVLFGVIVAYQKIVKAAGVEAVATQQPVQVQATDVAAPTEASTVAVSTTFTVEQAATLASDVLGHTDLYSGELTQLDGVDVYLITFSSGDLVYVSLTGQILSISKIPETVVIVPPAGGSSQHTGNNNSASDSTSTGGNSNNNNEGNDNGGENEHEDHDD